MGQLVRIASYTGVCSSSAAAITAYRRFPSNHLDRDATTAAAHVAVNGVPS